MDIKTLIELFENLSDEAKANVEAYLDKLLELPDDEDLTSEISQ